MRLHTEGRQMLRDRAALAALASLVALAASPAQAQNQVMCGTAVMTANASSDLEKAIHAVDRQESQAAAARQRQGYLDDLRLRREQARQYAAAARNGVALPADAASTLRSELKADIAQWREEFHVSRKESRAMEERWLVPLESLGALEWAQRRTDWWDARDSWVAAHGH
jgi:hypothetical protein